MHIVLLCLQLVAVASSQKSVACPDFAATAATTIAEGKQCLLHTRSQLRSLDGVTEGSETNHAAYELDSLGVLHKYHRERRESSQTLAQMTSQAARQSAWISYKGSMSNVLTDLERSRQAAAGQLEDTIDEFIAKQAGSEDACHAQLLEAKHQLNQLHLHVDDLSRQVNATDHEVTALNAQVEAKLEESKQLDEECTKKLEELEGQQGEDLKFLDTLRNELEEMIQIANPDVTMNQTAGQVFAGGKALEALLGQHAEVFLPFIRNIKIPSVHTLQQTGITSSSFIQMSVENDGSPTQVRREELAPLKAALTSADKCMKGSDHFSLLNARQNQEPLEIEIGGVPAETTPEPIEVVIGEPPKTTGKPVEVEILPVKATPEPVEVVIGEPPTTTEKPVEVEILPVKTTPKPIEIEINPAASAASASASAEAAEDVPTLPPAKNVICTAEDVVKVDVGGVAAELNPPRGLAEGEVAQVPCVKVNEQYFGAIWLTCSKTLTASTTQCLKAANATKCQEELEILQKVYIKTYVDLARLIQQYEEKTTQGYEAQKNAIEDECRDRREPIQNDAAKIATQVTEKVKTLEELRPKLEDALEAYNKLKEQVDKLSDQCKQLPETITDLDKVRDAIKALSLCPGLNQARLVVPKWVGKYVDFDQDAEDLSDEDYDAIMLQACNKAVGGEYPDKIIRAASIAEMAADAVQDLPRTNNGEIPLIGPCPGCEGDADADMESGHLRACWKSGVELTNADRSLNCNAGLKSVACVIDGDK